MTVVTCGTYLYSIKLKKFLVGHPTHSRWNTWSIPKGIREKDEDIQTVCFRELKEETGIDVTSINILASHQLPSRRYQKQDKTLESYLVVTDTDFTTHKYSSNLVEGKDFPEIDKWKWVELTEAVGILHQTQIENLPAIADLVSGIQ